MIRHHTIEVYLWSSAIPSTQNAEKQKTCLHRWSWFHGRAVTYPDDAAETGTIVSVVLHRLDLRRDWSVTMERPCSVPSRDHWQWDHKIVLIRQHSILIVSGSAYPMILIRMEMGWFHFVDISLFWRRVRVATVPMTGGGGGEEFFFLLFLLLWLLFLLLRFLFVPPSPFSSPPPPPGVMRLRFILRFLLRYLSKCIPDDYGLRISTGSCIVRTDSLGALLTG